MNHSLLASVIRTSVKERAKSITANAMNVCKRVYYSGHVQGVGFRFTAERLAARFAVAGFVRNLPGGEVELVVEGDEAEVSAFLAAIRDRMSHYVANSRVNDETPQGYSEFCIRT